jgi:hypothetical protein
MMRDQTMARFKVMVERTVYTPFFKVFEADTREQAEKLAEDEAGSLNRGREAQAGYTAGDESTDYQVKQDVTEAL